MAAGREGDFETEEEEEGGVARAATQLGEAFLGLLLGSEEAACV